VAQTGVILFMFVVGTRVELDVFRRHSRAIAATAAGSIAVPFVFGIGLALLLHPRFATPEIPARPFVLFVATALSVTAFPVLARILTDRGLQHTTAGRTALVCAAINDAVAWLLVASVIGLIGAAGRVPATVHGVFIAFAAGIATALIVPRVLPFVERIEGPTSRYLLPVFFALVGLRTDLQVLSVSDSSLLWCVTIVVVASIGKVAGAGGAAWTAGLDRRDALAIGILMNTRGLMELVVLNIGHDVGLLPARVFTMLVVMALMTTFMTGPLLRWVFDRRHPSERAMFTP
jgi:Kef-type K+ transport system membrane component KefB